MTKSLGFIGVSRDINEQKLAELNFEETKNKYETYVQNAPDAIFVTDEKMRYIEANRAASEMTGYSNDELLKMTVRDITPRESVTASKNMSQRIIEKGSSSAILKFIHKNGSLRWWNVSVVMISSNRFLGFAKDITEEKEIEKELVFISYHDKLTGLYNRRFFEEELKRLDTKRNIPISIVMADVNGLKIINDSFGHVIGDELLKKAADSITKGCRSDDIIARIGGDEFVILLPKTDFSIASKIVDRIKAIATKEKISNIELSISFGIETKTIPDQSIDEILALSENQMYKNKLYERSSMRSKTIEMIMNTLYEKSSRELQHSKRVSDICEKIAIKMKLKDDDINKIRTAGLVHDIGKIGIDEKILNKPGFLDEDEFKEIKKHPEIGWRILNTSNEFTELAQYLLEHHERWDGSGYPRGIKGEDISLNARIITIADAYDAMTSDRSYKKAMSKTEAIEEIKKCAGSHFDPQISSFL
jgi:diguanylate cyclase (GGDEF)-like protein/PAS domain S-box-containing protein/putative nucleotidyltransferase with HDIG domain